jgi:pyruvate dehydrogenase E2 component (dihydrolipoamide acetyltransferase)
VVEVKVPDIGDFAEVPVIELYVKVGDSIKVDDAIATLESDKATMDVPSTVAGTVKEVLVQLGSKVGEGTVLIKVETGASAPALRSASCCAGSLPPQHSVSAPVSASTAAAPRLLWPRPCRLAPRFTPRRPSAPMPANSASI